MSESQVSQARRSLLESSRPKKQAMKISEAQFYRGLRVVGLVFFTFLTLFPLYTIVTTSIKPLQDVHRRRSAGSPRISPSRLTATSGRPFRSHVTFSTVSSSLELRR